MVFHRAGLRRPDRRQAGKVKFLTIVLLAALVAGGYIAYLWVPLEIDNMDVSKNCDKAVNKTWKYHDSNETRAVFRNLLRRMGTHPVNEDGEIVQVPNIHPSSDDLNVQIDQSVSPAILSIDVRYGRTVTLPGLKRQHTFWFSDHCEQSLQGVTWN